MIEQRDSLSNERDQAVHQSHEQQARINVLIEERDQLNAQLQQQEDLMANLKSQYSESDVRQRLLNDEMIKAESQIELIKDLLLREPGL